MARQLSDLIVPGEPEQIASGLQFTEGPLWHPGGYLLFSDIPADTIYRWEPGREARRYIKPSRLRPVRAVDSLRTPGEAGFPYRPRRRHGDTGGQLPR